MGTAIHLAVLWLVSLARVALAWPPPPPSPFVSTQDGKFFVNGSQFRFIGTNAYWLPTLNSEADINNTLSSIANSNITVVRTWAFNDVDIIPEIGTWFQLIANGTTSINNGTNGLQRLDKVVELAEAHGIYLLLSLTNNWNPLPLLDNVTIDNSLSRRDVTQGTNNTLPRNTLSNDYGGMDVYVRHLGVTHTHDEFYTNETIIAAFENYTTQVVSRYVNSPSVLAWELANDPRCNSSLPATPSCNTTTITLWHSRVAQHIKSIDPNHLVTSGNQGFFCADCPKLFQTIAVPAPQPSPSASARKRNVPAPLTRSRILKERKESRKKTRALAKKSGQIAGGMRIRGTWTATPTRRQEDVGVGSAFDGSQGVDSEDIISIPQIGFGTFQLFPDQNNYGFDDPYLSPFNNTVQTGLDWILRHAESAQIFDKPISLTGFGLVTQENAPFFVPFNSTIAPFASDTTNSSNITQPFGVTDQQQDEAYQQWLNAGIVAGLQGIIQYQWSQSNLSSVNGTDIVPAANSTEGTQSGTQSSQTESGVSPNDGYAIQGVSQETIQGTLQAAAQQFVSN